MLEVIFPFSFKRTILGLTWLLLFSGGCVHDMMATHNRAGEITYTHVQGLTYEVVITTYTKSSALADRPWLFISWGDEIGDGLDSLARELPVTMMPGDIQKNIYRGTHTYGGPGIYPLTVEDPNRNEGVLNMTGSVDTPFAIQSLLIIDPQAGNNNSVQLLNPATENACLNQPWIHNPAAHDPDGDLLTYSLVPSRGFGGSSSHRTSIPTKSVRPRTSFPSMGSQVTSLGTRPKSRESTTWRCGLKSGEKWAVRFEKWARSSGIFKST